MGMTASTHHHHGFAYPSDLAGRYRQPQQFLRGLPLAALRLGSPYLSASLRRMHHAVRARAHNILSNVTTRPPVYKFSLLHQNCA